MIHPLDNLIFNIAKYFFMCLKREAVLGSQAFNGKKPPLKTQKRLLLLLAASLGLRSRNVYFATDLHVPAEISPLQCNLSCLVRSCRSRCLLMSLTFKSRVAKLLKSVQEHPAWRSMPRCVSALSCWHFYGLLHNMEIIKSFKVVFLCVVCHTRYLFMIPGLSFYIYF